MTAIPGLHVLKLGYRYPTAKPKTAMLLKQQGSRFHQAVNIAVMTKAAVRFFVVVRGLSYRFTVPVNITGSDL